MVCTYSSENLLFAVNQQCKITLSHFDKSSICWKHRTSNSLISNLRTNEREQTQAESKMQTHSLFLPKGERETKLEEVLTKRDCDFYYHELS